MIIDRTGVRERDAGEVREEAWQALLERIEGGLCTPFLGAGACWPTLPLGGDLAREWAEAHGYPFEDAWDLPRVAQFVGVHRIDPMWPKNQVQKRLSGLGPPDFAAPDEPHAALADLPLSVFLTTNYDDFMTRALRLAGKEPRRDFCRWNAAPAVRSEPRALAAGEEPTAASPLVYHLHGHLDVPQSLVLTEDDYIDFLVAVSRSRRLLPEIVQEALAGSSLLFVGYRLADWNFRVLYRGLVEKAEKGLRYPGVTVQLPPGDASANGEAGTRYLERYFGEMKVEVYWGDARTFVAELRRRWQERRNGA